MKFNDYLYYISKASNKYTLMTIEHEAQYDEEISEEEFPELVKVIGDRNKELLILKGVI